MYSSVPSPPAVASWSPTERRMDASPTAASPTSPTRTGRLRGLSYLRNYTSNRHSSSNNQRPLTLGRATSYPSPTYRESTASPEASPAPLASPQATSNPAPGVAHEASTNNSNEQGGLDGTGGRRNNSEIQSGGLPIATAIQSSPTTANSILPPGNNTASAGSGLPVTMARTRSATTNAASETPQDNIGDQRSASEAAAQPAGNESKNGMAHQLPSIKFMAHQDPRASRPSLVFSPMLRILPTGKETIKVGRYSEREHPLHGQAANVPSSAPVGFKSKVVSRRHCEFWCSGGRWFIKDVKSSSGTFLNHIRLSSPGTESRPFPVNDGDIVQLGIDFKGGEEMIFRCVKIRVELNKGWQTGPSQFNVQSHKRLRELNSLGKAVTSGPSQDCSICLGPIAPCQSLFVAPCSHTWHYKCIRVIINGQYWPHFTCPNCRSVADLEAELDDTYDGGWEDAKEEGVEGSAQPLVDSQVTSAEEPRRQNHSTEETTVEQPGRRPEQANHDGDMELGDSEDAARDEGVNEILDDLYHTHLDDNPSPTNSPIPEIHESSNATVAPVDIVARKAPASSSVDPSSTLDQPNHHHRGGTRTPSPNDLVQELRETTSGVEGPMTPRNDVGPFIFDGSGGRIPSERLGTTPTLSLDATASTSTPSHAPPAASS